MKPIIGQEAVVPKYGLGRVVSFDFSRTNYVYEFIEVKPYISNNSMKFDPKNVKLVKIIYEE